MSRLDYALILGGVIVIAVLVYLGVQAGNEMIGGGPADWRIGL